MAEKTVGGSSFYGGVARSYLKVARDYAERGDWLGAGANAAEAAKYFGMADRRAEQSKKAETARG